MSHQQKLAPTDPHATTPVPADERVGAVNIALVIIGVAIALPAFLIGAELGDTLGLRHTIVTSLSGGAILAVVATLAGLVGVRTRLSSYMLIQATFGSIAGKVANAVLIFSLLGWYATLLRMLIQAIQAIAASVLGFNPSSLGSGWGTTLLVLASALIILTTVWGFRALDKVSRFVTPLKVALLLLMTWKAYSLMGMGSATPAHSSSDVISAASAVAGGLIVAATLTPDLSRFARSTTDASLAVIFAYGLAFPGVLVCASIPAIALHQTDLVTMLVTLGLGSAALLIVILSTWISNTYNLYAGVLVLATIVPRPRSVWLAACAGAVGTLLAASGLGTKVLPYLQWLATVIPPISAVYIADFLILRRWTYTAAHAAAEHRIARGAAVAAWGTGVAVSYAAAHGLLRLSGATSVDSFATAFVAIIVFELLVCGHLKRTSTTTAAT